MGDGFYRSKDPTNSIEVLLKESDLSQMGGSDTSQLDHFAGYELTGHKMYAVIVSRKN